MTKTPDRTTDDARNRTAAILKCLDRRSIVLIGMMGAGKSSIGRRLADALGLEFVDADTEIERAANKTIPELFEEHGETYFRDGERRVIARLLGEGPQILATGGGAFMDPQTRQAILDDGVSIWLRAEFEVLMNRVRRKSHRPLLKDPDPEGVMRRLLSGAQSGLFNGRYIGAFARRSPRRRG